MKIINYYKDGLARRKLVLSLIDRIKILFALKGTWKWAKKQMRKGKIIRGKHYTGTLKYKIDDSENQLLLCDFSRNEENCKWETSNWHLNMDLYTDYYVFDWSEFNL